MNKKKELSASILIPAYNEEKSIRECVVSCLNQTEKVDEIIVVNDGSTDRTLEILKSFGDKLKIINLEKNTGNKSRAQEIGLRYIKTDIFITTDADTKLDKDFIKKILESFKKKDISAVCGFVDSEKNNWITQVREINYIIGQIIYKKAQAALGALFVLPGPASAFRTKNFREVVTFDHDNVTEDLDFTYKLKLSDKKIEFNEKAVVYTKDPNNLRSYFRQLYRWYSGGWTCLRKNIRIFKKPNNALILSPLYLEGLIMGSLFILAPLLIFINLKFFLFYLLAQFLIVSLTMSYALFKIKKRYNLYFYIPHHYFLGLIDQGMFLYTFIREFIFNKKNMQWQRADRY